MKNFKKILFVVIFVFVLGACQGNNPAPQETWKLVKLVTAGEESQDVITEVVTVRNCGIPEHKGVECSAGTTNDLSISLGGNIGYQAGFSGSIDASVSTGLGIGRTSGQNLDLDEPPQNKVYKYTIEKIYKVLVGDVLAQSSNGTEQTIPYTFHASCNLELKEREELSCNQTLPPTQTPSASAIYDNFNDTNYDDSFNNILWARGQGSSGSTQVKQQDGSLTIFDNPKSTGEGLILNLSNWQKSKFGFFEAKVKLHYENGAFGNITLNTFSSAIPSGWTEMGLIPISNGAILQVNVNYKSVVTKSIKYDTWYVLRVEYNDDTNTLNYFLDGEKIGSYTIPSKPTKITPGIQFWHPSGGFGTVYVDYVSIGD